MDRSKQNISTYLDIIVTELTCVTDRTVAAQCQGMPKNPQNAFKNDKRTMSKCSPEPFFKPRSGLSTINSEMCVSMNTKMYTRIDGTNAANGNQVGTGPSGISQPRLDGSLGEIPSGTLSFSV